jgi:phospho-N-acetylmuramoyl-pentapeptide-transferase
MFYYLAQFILEKVHGTEWADILSGLRLFKYITFRAAGSAVSALVISWFLGPWLINWLQRFNYKQEYLDKAEETGDIKTRQFSKKGTPTMGGILIVSALDISALLWAQWNEFVLLTLLSVIVLCGLGFYDDYLKVTRQNNKGTSSVVKISVQLLLASLIGAYLLWRDDTRALVTDVMVPFYKYPILTGAYVIGFILVVLAIVGSSNAVNLTDGIDGLAIGCTGIVSVVFLVMSYIAGHKVFATYLQVPYVAGAGELTIVCSAIIGASLGFLWYNCYPAQIFMGDTGSLALGGALGIIAILIHQPFVLVIAGGIFVLEALSVLIQRYWFKYTRITRGEGERVFKKSPLHHHFEMLGWPETRVTTRFYILCILFAVLALSTLKIR